ncbi:MAG: DNA replication complex GINS family protein [Candidatus Freyarchaeota archaeon]|nr:DNA replication complex GINS family protein [Candidatus Jordarchaeia archaeon]MBS7278748.1 DNA replication complex GINS family protein [Candidatus Jordarchaeia archaeon]
MESGGGSVFGVQFDVSRYLLRFENSPVKVIVVKDHPKIEVGKRSIGPFVEGREMSLRFWEAAELVQSGIVKYKEEIKFDVSGLYKQAWSESNKPQLQQIDPNFYQKLRMYYSDPIVEDSEKRRVEGLVTDLVSQRLSKILKIALRGGSRSEMTKNMTEEEKWLYDRLNSLLRSWEEGLRTFKREAD